MRSQRKSFRFISILTAFKHSVTLTVLCLLFSVIARDALAQTAAQTVFVNVAMFGGEVLINSTSWQQVTRTTYTSIPGLFAGVPVAANTTRKYYLVIRRADNQPGGNGSNWRFSCSAVWNGGTAVPGHGFTLGSDWGNPDEGTTDWVQVPSNALNSLCSPAYWEIDAQMVNSGPVMRVMSVSVAAVDVAGATSPGYSQSASGNDAYPPLSVLYDNIWTSGPGGNVGVGTTSPASLFSVGASSQFQVNSSGAVTSGSIVSSGPIGIGVSPQYTLDVAGQIHASQAIYASGGITFSDGSSLSSANTLCGGDYAESVDVTGNRSRYEPGDLLIIDPNDPGKFLKSADPYSAAVAGIYSTKPGAVGRRQSTPKGPDEIPMAVVGIVPAKVSAENGPIHPSDLLVSSSTLGFAMKGTDRTRMLGAVVGKAMGTLESGTGVIEVLVTLQ